MDSSTLIQRSMHEDCLPASFKVYIVEHLIEDIIKKHRRRHLRKLARISRCMSQDISDNSSPISLSSSPLNHSRISLASNKQYYNHLEYPLHFNYAENKAEFRQYSSPSPFVKTTIEDSVDSSELTNQNASSKYPPFSPNYNLHTSKNKGMEQYFFVSSPSNHNYQCSLIHHHHGTIASANSFATPSRKNALRVQQYTKMVSLAKIVGLILKRAVNTRMGFWFERLTILCVVFKEEEVSKTEQLREAQMRLLLDQIQELKDELMIKKEQCQIERKRLASIKQKGSQGFKQMNRDELNPVKGLAKQGAKYFQLGYSSDDETINKLEKQLSLETQKGDLVQHPYLLQGKVMDVLNESSGVKVKQY